MNEDSEEFKEGFRRGQNLTLFILVVALLIGAIFTIAMDVFVALIKL